MVFVVGGLTVLAFLLLLTVSRSTLGNLKKYPIENCQYYKLFHINFLIFVFMVDSLSFQKRNTANCLPLLRQAVEM